MTADELKQLQAETLKRKGRRRIVKKYIGKCWVCQSLCVNEDHANGGTNSDGILTTTEQL